MLSAAGQAWPPFVLVVGLLLIGAVAAEDGLFEAVGVRIAGTRLGSRGLLVALLGLVAVVTAVLNLDTAVVFLTPVLVLAARRRGLDERPFLYGSVFMANAASLLLPGSNLTNLLVLRRDPVGGARFAASMAPSWLGRLRADGRSSSSFAYPFDKAEPGQRRGAAAAAVRGRRGGDHRRDGRGACAAGGGAAGARGGTLRDRSAPSAAAARRARARLSVRAHGRPRDASPGTGTCRRGCSGASGRLPTAAIAAASSVVVNNLPAAVLLLGSRAAAPARAPARARPRSEPGRHRLALGGALASGRTHGQGRHVDRDLLAARSCVLVPVTLAGALAALWL